MAVTIRPAIGLSHAAHKRAGEDLERTDRLGHDFSVFFWGSEIDAEEEPEGMLIEGEFVKVVLILGTEADGALIEGGFDFESSIERLPIDGIRNSSRGSDLLFSERGAVGNGRTTPVVQKSLCLFRLELLACGYGSSVCFFSWG